ncbi:MAG: LysM domain-containing protein [Planctomycetia bacterium]|nr:LysM domain-containing protein [Planctomycetia bacterium]
MGRETKFLLAVLGVLAGAFLGVLSMKLLIPRPPAGAGPDVDAQESVAVRHDIVEPPALAPLAAAATSPGRPERRDPFVARAAYEPPADADPSPPTTDASGPEHRPAAGEDPEESRPPGGISPRSAELVASPITGAHVTVAGDTWWSIAERAYGDGRLYRALYAWNRRLDPRVSSAPGTRLDIPPRSKLAAAWPQLVPGE